MLGVDEYFMAWATPLLQNKTTPPLLFVSGAQGIGKSTAMNAISKEFDDKIAILGIDDFYLTLDERRALAKDVSPLFETRGPPGTHDLELLNRKIDELQAASDTCVTQIPSFDKVTDNRKPSSDWHVFQGRPKAIILEGWLIGASADHQSLSQAPMNGIEAADSDLAWREYQENQLSNQYAALWARTPNYFHLNAPSFETVLGWRVEQEETTLKIPKGSLPTQRREWVENFILYYERITRRMLGNQKCSGAQLTVDETRSPTNFQEK